MTNFLNFHVTPFLTQFLALFLYEVGSIPALIIPIKNKPVYELIIK